MQDKDNTYTWFNSDYTTNGGDVGYSDGGSCTGSICDTEGYVQAVNNQGLCGANDWRLPTVKELESVLSMDKTDPSIDSNYFPNTRFEHYWSATPSAYEDNAYAWIVQFYSGTSAPYPKAAGKYLRLVRDDQ